MNEVNQDVRIAGTGLVTPLGNTVTQTVEAILAGQFIRSHSRVPAVFPPGPRVTAMAAAAARQAISAAGWSPAQLHSDNTALIVGTSKGPVDAWLAALPGKSQIHEAPAGDSRGIKPTAGWGLAEISACLASDLGIGSGPQVTLSAACASGLHALIRACMLLQERQVRRVLVVAAESSLHDLFLASFERLGVLSREGAGCRPFDDNREGFVVSEAAAAVCLETAVATGDLTSLPGPFKMQHPNIYIESYAMGGDATHLTGGDPSAATMRYLLNRVIADRPVDLIHAHGTGTITNDPLELSAIDSSVAKSNSRPNLYSHKGALGHSLGASGLISVVLNCESHRRSIVFPNVRTTAPLHAENVSIEQEKRTRMVNRSVAIAAGFGGPTAVVSLRSSPETAKKS